MWWSLSSSSCRYEPGCLFECLITIYSSTPLSRLGSCGSWVNKRQKIRLIRVAITWRNMDHLLIWAVPYAPIQKKVQRNKPIHHFLMTHLYPMSHTLSYTDIDLLSPLITLSLFFSTLIFPVHPLSFFLLFIFFSSKFSSCHAVPFISYRSSSCIHWPFFGLSSLLHPFGFLSPSPNPGSSSLHLFLPSPLIHILAYVLPLSVSLTAAHLCLVPCVTPRLPSPPVRPGTSSSSLMECWWNILKSSIACRSVHIYYIQPENRFFTVFSNKMLNLQPSPSTSSLSSTHSAPPQMINSGPGSIRGELEIINVNEENSILSYSLACTVYKN